MPWLEDGRRKSRTPRPIGSSARRARLDADQPTRRQRMPTHDHAKPAALGRIGSEGKGGWSGPDLEAGAATALGVGCTKFCASRKIGPRSNGSELFGLRRRRMKIVDRRLATLDRRTVRPRAKEAAAVYGTPEYRAWAVAVKQRARWRCEKCGSRHGRLYADHIVEIQDGGAPFDVSNGQALCAPHHAEKTAQERAKRARS